MSLAEKVSLLHDVPASELGDVALDEFLAWVEDQGITLYPAQEEALLNITAGCHTIIATPTGSGKSLIALGAHFCAASAQQRTFYTAPIKALVNEKFFELCKVFGAENVGMMTGDATVNGSAPIICATAEVVANMVLRDGTSADIGQIVMDEFHYYADPQRGWAWQVPLLELKNCQFVLLSATLGDIQWLQQDLQERTSTDTTIVTSSTRPVPLNFTYELSEPIDAVLAQVKQKSTPVYVVHFTQRAALERAQTLAKVVKISDEEKADIAAHLKGEKFSSPFGKTLHSLLLKGVGIHHAGMLPRYRRLVEKLAQSGSLPIISGTDTLGIGINVPIRTALLTGLAKFDGSSQRLLKAREFHQIAGRAGRAGFDTEGNVVVLAPEHEVANSKAIAKAGGDEKKLKRIKKKKAAPGEKSWNNATFEKIISAPAETLTSKFSVSVPMMMNLLSRPGDPAANVYQLIRSSHDTRKRQNKNICDAISIYRGLVESGTITVLSEPDEDGRWISIGEDSASTMTANQPLAPFALAAIDVLDPDSANYTYDLISLFEAILDDPTAILISQEKSLRGEAIASMKAEGMDYEERMALAEDISWPKPLEELIETAYAAYCESSPWAKRTPPSPKSIIRHMLENGMGFSDFVHAFGIARAEGALLRYLSDAYRTLKTSIPPSSRTEQLDDIVQWLGGIVATVDSSLVDEWAALAQLGDSEVSSVSGSDEAFGTTTIVTNTRAFTTMVRNSLFRRIELLARDDIDTLVSLDHQITSPPDWDHDIDPYWDDYNEIDTSPQARGSEFFIVSDKNAQSWHATHILCDPAGDKAWRLNAVVDVQASADKGEVCFGSIEVSEA